MTELHLGFGSSRLLNLRIAEMMGWKWDNESACSPAGGCYSRTVQRRDGLFWWLPHYSTDMRDAWKVALRFADVYLERDAECHAFLSDIELGQGSGTADSMPLAICHAVLDAIAE